MGKLWEKLGSRGSHCYESFRRHGAAAWIRISLKRWCSCCSAASNGRFHLFVPFTIHLRNFRGEVSEKSFLVVRTSLSLAITLRKEGRVGLLGETPNGLSASKTLNESHLLVYTTLVCQASSYTPASLGCTILSMKLTANANRQSHFDECHQLFIPTHNVTLAIATMRVGNPDCLPVGIDSRDTAPTPTGSAKPVCDNFPAFHEFDGSSRCS